MFEHIDSMWTWTKSWLKGPLATFRLWAAPGLEAVSDYAQATMLSWPRLLVVLLIFAGAFVASLQLRDETDTGMIAVWWYMAVVGYAAAILTSIPEPWWVTVKEWQGRLGYLLALAVATVSWLSAGIASSEINTLFELPATMLPFAFTAYSFGIAVLFVAALGVFVTIPLMMLSLISVLVARGGEAGFKRSIVLAVVYLLSQLWFFYALHPFSSGYAGPVIERLALEFDFDEKVLCKNLPDKGKYLYLNANRNLVFQVTPLPEWNMTSRAMTDSKARGEQLSAIASKLIVKCVFEDGAKEGLIY